MNNDQTTVSWMVIILILLTAWLVYKPWFSQVLFNAPTATQPSGTPWWETWANPLTSPITNPLDPKNWLQLTTANGTGSAGTPDSEFATTGPVTLT